MGEIRNTRIIAVDHGYGNIKMVCFTGFKDSHRNLLIRTIRKLKMIKQLYLRLL